MSNEITVYHFEQGIPGFEHLKRFIFETLDEAIPMMLMKSVEEADVSLPVVNPFSFFPGYEWELSDSAKQELNISKAEEVAIWSIVTITETPATVTINLLAPIVLNKVARLGKQLILHDSSYSSRAPLINE